jgi:hypothetical protein
VEKQTIKRHTGHDKRIFSVATTLSALENAAVNSEKSISLTSKPPATGNSLLEIDSISRRKTAALALIQSEISDKELILQLEQSGISSTQEVFQALTDRLARLSDSDLLKVFSQTKTPDLGYSVLEKMAESNPNRIIEIFSEASRTWLDYQNQKNLLAHIAALSPDKLQFVVEQFSNIEGGVDAMSDALLSAKSNNVDTNQIVDAMRNISPSKRSAVSVWLALETMNQGTPDYTFWNFITTKNDVNFVASSWIKINSNRGEIIVNKKLEGLPNSMVKNVILQKIKTLQKIKPSPDNGK